jgi:hypothetical protein
MFIDGMLMLLEMEAAQKPGVLGVLLHLHMHPDIQPACLHLYTC